MSVTTALVVDPIPVGGGGPQDVAGGPGGQVAYGNPNANATELGRLVPGGTPLPTPIGATDPFGVVFGADHAYWFAQFNTSNLGRLTPDGSYTQLGGLAAGRREIAAGPGNTLWLSLETAKKVARVSGVEVPVVDDPGQDPHPGRPVVSKLKLSRAKFHKGTKTTIAFGLSEPAQVRLSFAAIKRGRKAGRECRAPARKNRGGKRCRRFVTVKPALTVTGKAGRNEVRFDGRLSRRRSLRPGPYRLTVSATDGGGLRSKVARASFRLLR